MLWVCEGCGTRYAESLEACPQCGGGERHAAHEATPAADGSEDEEADEVPKITTHGGATFPQDHSGASAEAVVHPADGTLPPPVDNGGGAMQAATTVLPPEPGAVPDPPAAAAEPQATPAPKKPAPSLSKAKAGE